MESQIPYIPVEKWGKDHWSMLAYIDTRIVDHHGILDYDHLRINARLHPAAAAAGPKKSVSYSGGGCSQEYPTLIKGEQTEDGKWTVVKIPDHDDINCIIDILQAGFLTCTMPTPVPEKNCFIDAAGHIVREDSSIYVDRGIAASGAYIPISLVTGMGEDILSFSASFSLTPTGQAVCAKLREHKGHGGTFHSFQPA